MLLLSLRAGAIPCELGFLTALSKLLLGHNFLTGEFVLEMKARVSCF